jgi:undecaprenyl-diphosphatase
MNKLHIILTIILLSISFNLYGQSFDVDIMRAIHTNRNSNLDGLMKGMSNTTYIILPAIPISLFIDSKICDCEDKMVNSIEIGASIFATGISSLLIKEIIKRPRPFATLNFVDNIGNESGYSMPSMHTATAFALATSITLIEPKWYFVIPAYMWSIAVAYSRIHLGVHYFSDVIVGAIIGTGISFATHSIFKSLRPQYHVNY